MERLWAPWRMEFIEGLRDKGSGCLFCELAAEGDDRERMVLHRGKHCFTMLNRFPYNNGHLMIVPYKHTGNLMELSIDEQAAMMGMCARSIDIVGNALNAEGFNCGLNIGAIAGAGIRDHVHLHVVPRWSGDSNFMPVISDTRAMPEYLNKTYDRLTGLFGEIEGEG